PSSARLQRSRREGHWRLLGLAFPRDQPRHALRRPSVGAGRDCPPRARAGQIDSSTCRPEASGGQFGSPPVGARLEGGRTMSHRETARLRVLIANEGKDRLALVAPIVAASRPRGGLARN